MTNPAGFDFTKFVPGFDFLKNITPGGNASTSTAAPGWVAPTLDPEELDKRIQELKTVQFWLEQNTKAVAATIQALEVQRMTLNTLKGMNMSFNDLAESLKVNPQASASEASKYSFAQTAESAPEAPASETSSKAVKSKAAPRKSSAKSPSQTHGKKAAAGVDPSHWWGALTDQFQHIATHAMNDMAHRAQAHATTSQPVAKKTAPAAKSTTRQAPARKTVAKKKR